MLTQSNRLLVLLALGGLLTRPAMAKTEEPQTLVIDGDTLVVQIAKPLPAGLHTLVVDGDTLMVQVLAESLPEDDPPLDASDKRLVGPAQAVSVDSSASVQAETGAARRDSLSDQLKAMVERYQKKADKRVDLSATRIAKKVVVGGLSGFLFGVVEGMAVADAVDSNYDDDGLSDVGEFAFGLSLGNAIGTPIGVSVVDSQDNFLITFGASALTYSTGCAVFFLADPREPKPAIGYLLMFFGPIISSTLASEIWRREPSQDRRLSIGWVPTPKKGLSAVAKVRF